MKKLTVVLFIALSVLTILGINNYYKTIQKEQLERTTQVYLKTYQTIYTEKKRLANMIYTGIKHITKLEDKMYKIQTATDQEKNILRKEIYHDIQSRFFQSNQQNITK